VLGGGAPVYIRESKKPEYLHALHDFNFSSLPETKNIREIFLKIFSSPNISSKKWVYEQYDSMVRTNTITGPGSDAAVILIKENQKAIAASTDCNGRFVYLNPKVGTKIAVAESARNIVCSGGTPLAITNCLNFGNPYKPEMYWTFKEAIAGMGEACRVFETPVTGGNVSFYNESPNTAVYPTPVIGMIGLIEDVKYVTPSNFKNENDLIYVLGEDYEEIGGSEYLKIIHNLVTGNSPIIDLNVEKNLHTLLLKLIHEGLIVSAHDISEGGISASIAECCILDENKMIGADVKVPIISREDFSLFSESQSRVIVSIKKENKQKFESICSGDETKLTFIGETGGQSLTLNENYKFELNELKTIYYKSIPELMNV